MANRRDAVDTMLDQWKRERPDLDSAGMPIVLRISMLSSVLADRLKAILEPSELAPWEFDVLSALRRESKTAGVPARVLCEAAQLTSGAMTHRLDRLEKRGLVRRKASATDRRSILISLTRKGRTLVDSVMGSRMEDARECVASLSAADRRVLARLLRQLGLEL